MSISENIAYIRSRIAEHASRAGRDPSDVTLMAVSKTVEAEYIIEAFECGLRDFGENYAQEFRDKYRQLGKYNERINWHFIGALQKNKVKYLVGKVGLIHSIHKFSVAEEIDKRFGREGLRASVLIEINNGDENTKAGVKIEEAGRLLTEINKLENINVEGFMTMAPYYDDPGHARPLFREIRSLRDSLSGKYPDLKELSMGMSNDFTVAIEEGSTIIRLGTSIFGPRDYD